ncbi:MAG: STAS domain-containing protein [Chlamydiia bacterium]|nr:STAS domain-containing protein [Chlamydiia bacterium]
MNLLHEFIPKSYHFLRSTYTWDFFKKDLVAGITVGIISLPLAMAFAIASGVTPDRGLFTAIVAGFLISALGGSRVQIGGPTGAFVVIVYGVVQRTGYEGLAVSTLVAAAILVFLGLLRLGSWIRYVPYPLTTGFTTGLALIIFSSQVKDFFGLQIKTLPVHFIEKWHAYFNAFPTLHPLTMLFGVSTLAFILVVRRFAPKLPWGIAAIAFSTLVCWIFQIPVETIQSKFGQIPSKLPMPQLPSLVVVSGNWYEIIMNGVAIAFLGAIESLLCCVIADGMMGGRHRSNCELIGQGIANCASILFGGIPATGAIARTAANIKMGAQTPMAGMIHAATLLGIILFLAPIVSQIPLASLAAVLMVIAWNMSEIHHFLHLLKAPIGDVLILLTAFLLTVFVDITLAITLGMTLAAFVFMQRMGNYSKAVKSEEALSKKEILEGVEVYEIQGPFFFGAAGLLKDVSASFPIPPRVFILRMHHVSVIDATGMHALREFHQMCQKGGTLLLLSGVHAQSHEHLKAFGLVNLIGESKIFAHIDEAITYTRSTSKAPKKIELKSL